MTSPIHQFVSKLTESKLFGRVVGSLPTEVRDALEDLAANDKPTLIRSEPLAEGEPLRGVAVFLGEVRRGAALRGVNLMKGTITGGTVRGCDVGVVDLADGDVRGGRLDVNVLLGNVYDGEVSAKIHVGEVMGGSMESDRSLLEGSAASEGGARP